MSRILYQAEFTGSRNIFHVRISDSKNNRYVLLTIPLTGYAEELPDLVIKGIAKLKEQRLKATGVKE